MHRITASRGGTVERERRTVELALAPEALSMTSEWVNLSLLVIGQYAFICDEKKTVQYVIGLR